MDHVIPLITDPMGRYWDQPSRDRIQVDEKNALMGKATFDALSEYSTSTPTGVYPGKMWKMHQGEKWWLRWFGESADPSMCSNHHREIILV